MDTFLWILIIAIVVIIYYNVTTLAVYNGIKTFIEMVNSCNVVQFDDDNEENNDENLQ